RLERVKRAVAGAARPRVAALEWLAPPMVGGHWVPEMISLAGGEDVLGEAGSRSRAVGWDQVTASRPDVVVVMPCGYDAETARRGGQERPGYNEGLPLGLLSRDSWAIDPARIDQGTPLVRPFHIEAPTRRRTATDMGGYQ